MKYRCTTEEAGNRRGAASRRSRRQKGFTIVEVLGAAFVLTIAIASSLVILGRGFAALDSARWISYASQIMQSEFEKMRLTPWLTISGTGVNDYNPAASEDLATATPVTIDPTYYTSVGDIGTRMSMTRKAYWANGHTTDMEVVAVKLTLTWKTRNGRQLSRSYITYYGKNGLYDYISS